MVLKVLTTRIDFNAASDDGYIYGKLMVQGRPPVYVELGNERDYIVSPKDNPKTDYKYFASCNVYVAESEEELDREIYIGIWTKIPVIILC